MLCSETKKISQIKKFSVLALLCLVLLGLCPEGTWAYETPEGYDEHDYQKLVTFLEQSDGSKTNGKK